MEFSELACNPIADRSFPKKMTALVSLRYLQVNLNTLQANLSLKASS